MATSASFEARSAPSSTRPPKSSLAGLSYKIRTSVSAQIESGGNSWLCSSFCPRGTDAIARKDDRIRKIEVCPGCNVKALDHFQSRRVYRSLSDNDFRFAGNPRWLRGHYSPRIGNEVRQRDGFFHPANDYRCDGEEPFRRGQTPFRSGNNPLRRGEDPLRHGNNYFESPANPVESKDGGFALIDNYFRHGNDLICVGKDYLKNGNNPFQRRLNFLQLAHNPLRNERIYFLHQCIHFHRGHIHSREGERFFHGGHDHFRLGQESRRDRNEFPRRGENPRRCAGGMSIMWLRSKYEASVKTTVDLRLARSTT